MEETEKKILMKEYAAKFKKFIYWPLKWTGFCRFDIDNGEIIQLTRKTMLYNTIIVIMADCCVAYLLYSSILLGNYLNIPDALCVIHFAFIANFVLLNLTYINRRSGLDIVEQSMEMDCFLGIKETTFIRDVAIRTFFALFCTVFIGNLGIGVFIYQVYKVSLPLHIAGSLFFFWLFFAYNDFAFSLMLCILNCLRIRYLNVALLKIGDMNEEYVPSQSILNMFLWNKKFNNLVTFHQRAGVEEFNRAFRMCFDSMEILEKYFAFPLMNGVWTIVVGSFVAVQTFIMCVKNPTAMDIEHTYVIGGWVILGWSFFLGISTIIDMISQQIQQSKLICSYIQLKPNKSADVYKLTKTVLGTIKMRNPVINIYNLFHLNSGFIVRIAASTLVYITVQLQLAFPGLPITSPKLNETTV